MSNYSGARSTVENGATHAAETAANVMRDKFAEATDALKEGTERVKASAERVQGEAGAVAKKVGARVSERPVAALAATLAIGAIAGYLLGRR